MDYDAGVEFMGIVKEDRLKIYDYIARNLEVAEKEA